MSLLVYEQTSPGVYVAFSISGTHTDPITTVHHGRNGDTFERKLYVGRESGNANTFTNVRVKPDSLTAEDDIGSGSNPGSTGWGIKVMVDPGHDPTEAEWDATDYGDTIRLSDISSDAKLPFWLRIESPRGISIQNKKNITLLLMFTETP
jgi:hypothetical protein